MERGGGPRNIRKTWGGCGVFEPPRHGGPEVAEKPEVHGISPYLRASVSLWFHFRRLPQAGAVGPWRRVVRCLGGFAEAHAPDRWQALAVQALRAGRDVIVDAPTGNGENLPARALVGDGAPMTGHNHNYRRALGKLPCASAAVAARGARGCVAGFASAHCGSTPCDQPQRAAAVARRAPGTADGGARRARVVGDNSKSTPSFATNVS